MLRLTREQVSAASKVAVATLADFEVGRRQPQPRTIEAIRLALEAAGVEFLPDDGNSNPGVRLRGSVQWRFTHRGDLPPADRVVTIQRENDRIEAATFSRETRFWRIADTGEEVPEASVNGWDMGDFPLE